VACIAGPTAAGKSALALALAARRGLTLVSADSRQVYRRFDVGTAKPSLEERRLVPHEGIDVVDPTVRYSAHQWATQAAGWGRAAVAAGRPPVFVGGTGLYLRALVEPLAPVPTLDPGRRAVLSPWLDALPAEELHRWCQRLDPSRADIGRTQRLRAVETALLAGTRISAAMAAPASEPLPVRYLVVDPGPTLADRIASRVQAMVGAGFVEEVDRLRREIPADAPAWQASGYAVVRDALEGQGTVAMAIERVIIETRQYAKRQRTWIRHQLPAAQVTRVNPLATDALDQVLAWWDAREGA
jgi:tRNA dimethylallyltransferase